MVEPRHGSCYNHLQPRASAPGPSLSQNQPHTNHMKRTFLPFLGAAALACATPCFADGAPAADEADSGARAVLASRDIGDPEANLCEEGR